jgi:hypothetical protein
VLAWENEQDFVDLHDSIRQELNPVGSLEDITVLDIARLHWVKRRLNVGAQLAYHRHPDVAAMIKAGEEGWQGVRNYLRDKAGHTDTVAKRIRDSSKEQLAALKDLLQLIKTAQMSSVSTKYKPKLRRIQQSDGYDLVETISVEVQALWQLGENLKPVGPQIAPMLKLIE